MNERVLIIVDNLHRAAYYGRFVDAFAQLGIPVRFLPYRLSAHKHLVARGLDSVLFGPSRAPISSDVDADCRLCLEVLSGDAPLRRIQTIAPRLAAAIQDLIADFRPTHLFLWNGSQLVERLAKRVCPPDVATRFFEIANIPGKMFVDADGVNAASSLYSSPEQLAAPSVDDEEFERWRTEYLSGQRTRGVPQAKAAMSLQWERPIDAIASKAGRGFYPITPSRMLQRFQGKLTQTNAVARLAAKFARPTNRSNAYRFFPLQVSGDTQLLLNSDVNNLQALDQITSECVRDSIELVIKIHPAENNQNALTQLAGRLTEARKLFPCFISTDPTPTLIENASKIYTINSTVGLETLILRKPLKVFGRAFFQHFVDQPDWLRTYILRYLIDVDYFSSDPVDVSAIDRCLKGWSHA